MEHHMFPLIPYYNLPALHEEIKQDCPTAAPSFPSAVRETISALWQSRKNPEYVVPKYREFAERTPDAKLFGRDQVSFRPLSQSLSP